MMIGEDGSRQMLRLQSHQSSKQFSISVIKVGALLKMRDPLFKKHILFSCHVPGTVVDRRETHDQDAVLAP